MGDMQTINIAPTSWTPFLKLALESDLPDICEKAGIDITGCYTYGLIQELIPLMEKIEKFVKESA